jgi:uncharacterized Tic20 family protein
LSSVADTFQTGSSGRLVDPYAGPGERTYALFNHLTLLTVHGLFPVVPALIMWLIKRHESPFLDDHGKEAVNFQLSLVVYGLAALALMAVIVGIPLMVGVYVLGMVGMIRGAMAANRGEYYRYPMCLRFIR